MCRFCGIVDFRKRIIDKNILSKMNNSMIHGGPDNEGYYYNNSSYFNIGMAHRRLSIIDVSDAGNQPMVYKNHVIVFNGEIYNFKEIKSQLIKLNFQFKTNSDTEVILKAFFYWNLKCFEKFNGMFSIVIYIKNKDKLILARDRMGVKPLFYYFKDGLFLFSSEIKAITMHNLFDGELNVASVPHFLSRGYIKETSCIYKNIRKLQPSTILSLQNDSSFKLHKYQKEKNHFEINFNEKKLVLKNLEEILFESFKYRLVSDVDVGVFLSGGVDSTLLTTLLQNHLDERIKTYTVSFDNENQDESKYANLVAKKLETDHTNLYVDTSNFLETIEDMTYYFDEPFGDVSCIPTMMISKKASNYIKVVLSGDGADELFAGYTRHKVFNYSNLILNSPLFLKKSFNKVLNKNYNFLNKIFSKNHSEFNYKIYKLKNLINAVNHESLIDIISSHHYYNDLENVFDDFHFLKYKNNKLGLKDLLEIDLTTYLPSDILVKSDRSSMAYGLEMREPYLDDKLIDFSKKIPEKFLIKKGQTKYLLKQILLKYYSKDFVNRPKHGFNPPLKNWLNYQLKNDIINMLEDNLFFDIFKMNKNYIKNYVKSFYQSKNNVSPNFIWNIYILYNWKKRWIQ